MGDTRRIVKSEAEWQRQLTSGQYEVCRRRGTERAFTGKYCNCTDEGVYVCVCCGAGLFDSDAKYDSGTGWPSFCAPLGKSCVKTRIDNSLDVPRVEVLCRACDSHLGHVFDDGPPPTGLRYCINSVALQLSRRDRA